MNNDSTCCEMLRLPRLSCRSLPYVMELGTQDARREQDCNRRIEIGGGMMTGGCHFNAPVPRVTTNEEHLNLEG